MVVVVVLFWLRLIKLIMTAIIKAAFVWQVMRYTPKEWTQIGFGKRHAKEMGRQRVQTVFGLEYDALVLLLAAYATDMK